MRTAMGRGRWPRAVTVHLLVLSCAVLCRVPCCLPRNRGRQRQTLVFARVSCFACCHWICGLTCTHTYTQEKSGAYGL